MKDKIHKFISVVKRDGIFITMKKTINYILSKYVNKLNIQKRINWELNKNKISKQIDKILTGNSYDIILVWRGSFGWNVPLYQRPQQIAKCLANKKILIFYEVTRMTDEVEFIQKKLHNLYLVNYELNHFEKLLFEKIKNISKPKYLQLYSTCWDVKKEIVDKYINNGFDLLYEYIDDLNPVLAGTKNLPENVKKIHDYVINNKSVFVVTTADQLYNDMVTKRGDTKNIILSSNGADIEHFKEFIPKKIPKMETIRNKYKTIVGYYGALASWFDYSLVKKLAIINPDVAFVMIGLKYDTTFDESEIEKIKNIIYLGTVNYMDLPNYGKYFDIAWIPFVINDITISTNPIKVFEYMALNKLIITSELPECKKYKSVYIAKNIDEYNYYIENYKKLRTKEYIRMSNKEASENSWQNKADDIINLLKVKNTK